ncbi:hypothetical protein GCM10027596_35850 [Nocardioides korecus]
MRDMLASLLTETELAEVLRLETDHVRHLRQREGWPHVKLGRQVRFTEDDVRDIIKSHHVVPSRPHGLPGQTPLSIARNR